MKPKQVNNTMRAVRNHFNLSQKQVAAKLGMSVSNYSYYETDPFLPNKTFIEKLAVVYSCTVAYIENYQEPNLKADLTNSNTVSKTIPQEFKEILNVVSFSIQANNTLLNTLITKL